MEFKSPQISFFFVEMSHNWQGNTGFEGLGLFTIRICSAWSLWTNFHIVWCKAMKRWYHRWQLTVFKHKRWLQIKEPNRITNISPSLSAYCHNNLRWLPMVIGSLTVQVFEWNIIGWKYVLEKCGKPCFIVLYVGVKLKMATYFQLLWYIHTNFLKLLSTSNNKIKLLPGSVSHVMVWSYIFS